MSKKFLESSPLPPPKKKNKQTNNVALRWPILTPAATAANLTNRQWFSVVCTLTHKATRKEKSFTNGFCKRHLFGWVPNQGFWLFSSLRKHMSHDRTARLHQLLGDYLALTNNYQEALDQYTQALRWNESRREAEAETLLRCRSRLREDCFCFLRALTSNNQLKCPCCNILYQALWEKFVVIARKKELLTSGCCLRLKNVCV